jgi:hypothetical protein
MSIIPPHIFAGKRAPKPGVGPTNAHHEFIVGLVLILKLI